MSSAFSSSPSPSLCLNILKETLFPDYGALYRRTRKYKFWPRHLKSYFLSISLTVKCLHLLKDIDIMVFVMLLLCIAQFQMWIPVKTQADFYLRQMELQKNKRPSVGSALFFSSSKDKSSSLSEV